MFLIRSASYNTAALATKAATGDTWVVSGEIGPEKNADNIPGWNNGQFANGNGDHSTLLCIRGWWSQHQPSV